MAAADPDVIGRIAFPEGTRHGKALVPSIEDLCRQVSWSPEDIDVVAVSIGPGSYTGLRVGLVCARMICRFAEAELVAVPSLDVIARNAPYCHDRICVIVDARRNEIYSAAYERRSGVPMRRTDPAIVTPEALLGNLAKGTYLIGDGIPVVVSSLEGRDAAAAPEEEWTPRAETVAEIGSELYTQGVRHDVRTTEPMYLRRPAAEEKWECREAASQ